MIKIDPAYEALKISCVWHPIANAPKDGTIIHLRSECLRCEAAMYWNRRLHLWVGQSFGVLGVRRTFWDEAVMPVFEWRPMQ